MAICGLFLLLLALFGLGLAHPQNVILLIPDGGGQTLLSLTREIKKSSLVLDQYYKGMIQTSSASNHITDSAAGGTAYATGYSTMNDYVGINSSKHKVASILEAAKAKGMVTGIITTARLTDATPASFMTHVENRSYEDEIMKQIIYSKYPVDFALGGGNGCMTSEMKLKLQNDGYEIVYSKNELKKYAKKNYGNDLRLYGFFAEYDMKFEIDREKVAPNEPSLSEMVEVILSLLAVSPKAKKNGYVIMIESSNIDLALHNNDAGTGVYEYLHYDKMINTIVQKINNETTSVVSVADHETGGLSLGRVDEHGINQALEGNGVDFYELNPYDYSPSMFHLQKYSIYELVLMVKQYYQQEKNNIVKMQLRKHRNRNSNENSEKFTPQQKELIIQKGYTYLIKLLRKYTPLKNFTKNDDMKLHQVSRTLFTGKEGYFWFCSYVIGEMIGSVTGVAYGTGGHSAADVGLYCYGKISNYCSGVHKNIYVNHIIIQHLQLENYVKQVTIQLVAEAKKNKNTKLKDTSEGKSRIGKI